MIFMTIGLVVAVIATVFFVIMTIHVDIYFDGFIAFLVSFLGAIASISAAITLAVRLPTCYCDARVNTVLMQDHIENPSHYTYDQLVEHNKFVLHEKALQGTIFSFYNGVDLQTIDIDNISSKVEIK